ncbi:MAG: hypothetical protein AAFY56_03080 [Pseudomonadota bacterium]
MEGGTVSRLDIELSGAFDRRRWRWLRESVVGAKAAGTIATTVVVGVVLIAEDQTSLAGLWVASDGALLRIYHLGQDVNSRAVTRSGNDEFRTAGEYFKASLDGVELRGQIWSHRTDDGTECTELPNYIMRPLELRVVDDGERMEGRWLNWPFEFSSCRPTDEWEEISFTRFGNG